MSTNLSSILSFSLFFFQGGHLFVRRATFAGIYHREHLTSCIILHSRCDAKQKTERKEKNVLYFLIFNFSFSPKESLILKFVTKTLKRIFDLTYFIGILFKEGKKVRNCPNLPHLKRGAEKAAACPKSGFHQRHLVTAHF